MTEFALAGRLIVAASIVGCMLLLFRCVAIRLRTMALPRFEVFGTHRPAELAVIETVPLPGGSSLHVVRAGDRRFAIARSASAFALICELAPSSPSGGAETAREA